MIFSWFRNRHRQKLMSKPFPAEWEDFIRRNVVHASYLSAEEYARLKQWVQVFVAEKYWEGCDGLAVTDEMKATIAALAGFLVRKFDSYYFDRLQTILVFPKIVWRTEHAPRGGIVNEDPTARLGEALTSGPMSLVWPHVLSGAAGSRRPERGVSRVRPRAGYGRSIPRRHARLKLGGPV